MDTPRELMIFNGNVGTRQFLYLYQNVVTEVLPDNEKGEKLWPF